MPHATIVVCYFTLVSILMETVQPIAPTDSALAQPSSAVHQFTFTGKASEFFRIWIVNTTLTIITLGIYSAWAKVRTNRYFYGNTHLAEHVFAYLAQPMAILIGRLIVLGVIVLGGILGYFYLFGDTFVFLLLFLFVPILVVRSLSFRMRNTAYRNVRFGFVGKVKEAYIVYGLGYLAVVFSAGLAYPWFKKRTARFALNNTQFGQMAFNNSATTGAFYKVYCKALGIFVAIVLGVALVSMFIHMMFINMGTHEYFLLIMQEGSVSIIAPFIGPLLVYTVVIAVITGYLSVAQFTLLMNTTTIDKEINHQLISEVCAGKYVYIFVTNTLATLLSLGLAYPWAKVRLARYVISNCKLIAKSDMNNIVAVQQKQTSAIGEELGSYMDIDLSV